MNAVPDNPLTALFYLSTDLLVVTARPRFSDSAPREIRPNPPS